MKITLKRISPTHHELAYFCPDHRGESVRLETKSLLFHDLLHFAAESVAGLNDGFWGQLAAGKSLEALKIETPMDSHFVPHSNLEKMELIVGALTGLWKNPSSRGSLQEKLVYMFGAYGLDVPTFITADYEERVFEHLNRLYGRWNALSFGESLTLEWSL